MAAGVAHEVLLGNATLLLDDLQKLVELLGQDTVADRQRLRAIIDAQSDVVGASQRISHIVQDMRALSQPEGMTGHSAEVAAAVAWAVRATAHEFTHRAVIQVENLGESCWVKLDSARLEQVLINLLVNAVARGRFVRCTTRFLPRFACAWPAEPGTVHGGHRDIH